MEIRPFDIIDAVAQFGTSIDRRPWLVAEVRVESVKCFPLTTKQYSKRLFPIEPDHRDFASTGLNRGCFIALDAALELPRAALQKHRGRLSGSLLEEFRYWSGTC